MAIELSDAAFEEALARGRERLMRPHAVDVRYDEGQHLLIVVFNTRLVICFDPRGVEILKHVSQSDLARAIVTPGGDGLIFGNGDERDAFAVSLPGLLAKIVPFGVSDSDLQVEVGT